MAELTLRQDAAEVGVRRQTVYRVIQSGQVVGYSFSSFYAVGSGDRLCCAIHCGGGSGRAPSRRARRT